MVTRTPAGLLQAGQCQARQQGGELVGFLLTGLLTGHKALARGPGRDQVRRAPALGPVMATPRSLTIDGDHVASGLAQFIYPHRKTGLETLRRQGVDGVIEGAVRGHAFRKRQKAARKIRLPVTPTFDLNKIPGPRHGRAQHNQKHFLQWVAHLPRLAGVIKGGKMVKQTAPHHHRPLRFRCTPREC